MNRDRLIRLGMLWVLLAIPLTGQVFEALHMDRESLYCQLSADTLVPAGDALPGRHNWQLVVGASFSSGSVFNPRIVGPGFPGGHVMEREDSEDIEYKFETGFPSESALRSSFPAGLYQFTGIGSGIGSFAEDLVIGELFPIPPKRITNFDALQAIDPARPFVIEWESFSEAGDTIAFIEVDIYAIQGEGYSAVWSSPEEEGTFGLDPGSTSVEVEAGILGADGGQTYELVVLFSRIEDLTNETGFGTGIKGFVTATETTAQISLAPDNGRVNTVPGEWTEDPLFGWLYGLDTNWSYSFNLGYVWVGQTPDYLYQHPLGWLACTGVPLTSGCWFYAYSLGWIFTKSGLGGWYVTLDGTWLNFIGQGKKPGTVRLG